jgi:PDZ domain-containing protein
VSRQTHATPRTHAPDGDDGPATAASRRRRPSMLRTAFYAGTLAVLVLATGFTPLPFVRYVPGSPQELAPLIEISGVDTTSIEGETALLTVFLDPVTPVEAVAVWFDPTQGLTPVENVAPGGELTPEFFAAQREQFSRQFQVATAVGAEAAGVEVELRTSALVVDVLDGGPADGALAPGDEVVAFDGERLVEAAQLQTRTRATDAGATVTLTVVDDDGDTRDVEVTLERLDDTGQVGLGVLVQTVADELDLPFEVALGDTRIGGPSAGMMTALTVYDLLSDEDLTAGRTVVGTGTIDAEGTVGPIGGVGAKVRSAVRYGADVVLVPEAQLAEATAAGPPDEVEVVGVATFDDVLAALR